jgi:pyruvate-formate lyase-activating enzyme/glutaredoxin
MPLTVFSAPGCVRCKIIKQALADRGLAFEDHNALGDGREAFKVFYQQNRANIYRSPEGVEFPVYYDGEVIIQGIGPVFAHLAAGPALKGFFKPGVLHGQWVDGIDVSSGDPGRSVEFLGVLGYLKKQRFKLQLETNGINAELLEETLRRKLVDRIIMHLKGPLEVYPKILGRAVDPKEIKKSISLVASCEDYQFVTTIMPIVRDAEEDPAGISYITPEEVAETAHLIQRVTGDNRQPYFLSLFDPKSTEDERLKGAEALPQNAVFPYRTHARRFQVKTEILQN